MAIAHICIQCGWDLARVRASREPRYGLPLVICPRCHAACVRREHPVWIGWKRLRRVDCAITALGVQLALIALFSVLHVLATFALVMILLEVADEHSDDIQWLLFFALVVLPLAIGTWLTAAFSHLKRWRVWCGWLLFMLALMGALGWHLAVIGEFSLGAELVGHTGSWLSWDQVMVSVLLFTAVAAMPLCAVMVLATAGIPLGKTLLWLFAWFKRMHWRWRRRMRWRQRNAG